MSGARGWGKGLAALVVIAALAVAAWLTLRSGDPAAPPDSVGRVPRAGAEEAPPDARPREPAPPAPDDPLAGAGGDRAAPRDRAAAGEPVAARLRLGAPPAPPADRPPPEVPAPGADDWHARGPGPGGGALAPAGEAAPEGAEEAPEPMIWAADREGIQGAMAEARGAIAECYRGWARAQPDLAGRLDLRFTVEASEGGGGRVAEVEVVGSELDHAFMEGCVHNAVSELRFEAPAGRRLVVTYPFVFKTTGGAEAVE